MPVDFHLALPRQISAAGIARKALVERFADQLGRVQSGDLALVVTELVTNAVVHGRGAISLSLRIRGDRVYGEVDDEGGGFERALRERGPDDLSGRGLLIVDALCSRWGIHEGTTHVWFELARPHARTNSTEPKFGDAERPAAWAHPAAHRKDTDKRGPASTRYGRGAPYQPAHSTNSGKGIVDARHPITAKA